MGSSWVTRFAASQSLVSPCDIRRSGLLTVQVQDYDWNRVRGLWIIGAFISSSESAPIELDAICEFEILERFVLGATPTSG